MSASSEGFKYFAGFWILVAVFAMGTLCVASCAGSQTEQTIEMPSYARQTAVNDDVQTVPFLDEKIDTTGGNKNGLCPIDTPKQEQPRFDLPSPIFVVGDLIRFVIGIVGFVVQVSIVVLVAWVIVRAINRKRETGTIIPAKGEKTIFDRFDNVVSELKARRAGSEKELVEIEKRVPGDSTNAP